jgi:hypothetical protein
MSHSEFTLISSKNVNLNKVKINTNKSKGQTQGRACHYAVLFFTIGEPTNLDKALDEALLAKRAEVLLEADVSWQFVWIPFIYTQECWKVEGTAYDIF